MYVNMYMNSGITDITTKSDSTHGLDMVNISVLEPCF